MYQLPLDEGHTLTLFPELGTPEVLGPLLVELGTITDCTTANGYSTLTIALHAPVMLVDDRVGAQGGISINPSTLAMILLAPPCPIDFGAAAPFYSGVTTIKLRLVLHLSTYIVPLDQHTPETVCQAVRNIAAAARRGFLMHRIMPPWVVGAPPAAATS